MFEMYRREGSRSSNRLFHMIRICSSVLPSWTALLILIHKIWCCLITYCFQGNLTKKWMY